MCSLHYKEKGEGKKLSILTHDFFLITASLVGVIMPPGSPGALGLQFSTPETVGVKVCMGIGFPTTSV